MPDVSEVPRHFRRCVARRSTEQHRRSIGPTRRYTTRNPLRQAGRLVAVSNTSSMRACLEHCVDRPSAGAIELGTRVCFTGSAIVDGASVSGETMEEVAADAGLEPVSRVTKSACDLLVAADPASSSGKTKAARRRDIPVISTAEFFAQIS